MRAVVWIICYGFWQILILFGFFSIMLKSLKLKIVSSRVVEEFENEKKYVAYMLQAKQNLTTDDINVRAIYDRDPVKVERRYTHFLDLYNGLKKEQPAMLQNTTFPRKVSDSCFTLPNKFSDSSVFLLLKHICQILYHT